MRCDLCRNQCAPTLRHHRAECSRYRGQDEKAPADTRRVRGRNDRGHHRLSEHELQRRLSKNHDHARKFPQSPLGDDTDAYGYAR